MPHSILYLLKLSISLSVVWLFYKLVLQRLTFYAWNRWYLLVYSLLSFAMPLIDINPWMEKQSFRDESLINYIPVLSNAGAPVAVLQPAKTDSWLLLFQGWNILLLVLVTGAVVLLIRLLFRIRSFRKIRRKARLVDHGDRAAVRLYHVEENIIPFSFGNAIYINQHLHTEKEWEEIILHEYVHVRQRHTIDILVGEWLCILNWYNPFAWLIRFSVRQNLEFIADNKVLENGSDRKAYQYHLLKVVGSQPYRIANNFNFSSLKKRILMMNRIKSGRVQLVKFLFLLPLMAVLLLAFRDQYKGIFERVAGSAHANFAGLVIDVSTHKPLAGVEVLDSVSGTVTVTDENGYYKISEPLEKDGAGVIRYKSGEVHLVFSKEGYRNNDRRMPSPGAVKGSFGWIFIIPMSMRSVHAAGIYVEAPSVVNFPEDPDYADVMEEFRKNETFNTDQGLFIKMLRDHPEVSLFYTSENKSRHLVVLRNGGIEKYGYPGGPGVEDMDKKYGPLPEMITKSPQQVSTAHLARWEGIAARLTENYHTANPDARRIIFPGDSRVLVVDRSGKTRMFDMESMAPEERPAFEKLYGKLPDFVPVPTLSTRARVDTAPADTSGSDTLNLGVGIRSIKKDSLALPFTREMLYVVDGRQMPRGWSARDLDQSSIQSVSVFKGPWMVHEYGPRANHGAIVIKTQKPGTTSRLVGPSLSPGASDIVPPDFVVVTAGGRVLKQHVDYTVDLIRGTVQIINQSILDSGIPVNVSLANNNNVSPVSNSFRMSPIDFKNFALSLPVDRDGVRVVVLPAKNARAVDTTHLRFGVYPPKPQPLYLVDGVEVDSTQILKLAPSDVKAINILKGDEADKKYGVEKAKNGVVEITMKKSDSVMTGKASAFVIHLQHPLPSPPPIFVVNGVEVDSSRVVKIRKDAIDSLSVLTGEDAVKRYGEKGRNGVWQIHLKNATP